MYINVLPFNVNQWNYVEICVTIQRKLYIFSRKEVISNKKRESKTNINITAQVILSNTLGKSVNTVIYCKDIQGGEAIS